MSTPESEISPETAESKKTDDGAVPSSLRDLAQQYTLQETPETADRGEQHQAKPGESTPKGKGKPKTLNDAAERLGVDVKDLYDLEIPSSKQGEKFTLGQLKDHLAEREDFTVSQLKLDEDRARMESGFMRAQQELQELLAALPKTAVKPEILEKIRTRHEATLTSERAKTLEAIPEWRDQTRREADFVLMIEHLKGFGFHANYLKSVYDHRTLKFVRDAALRKQRLDKALALVGEKKPSALGKGKSATEKKGAPTGGRLTREEQQVQRYLGVLNTKVN